MNLPRRPSPSRAASFRYAFSGIGYLLRTQPNARIHAAITIAVLILGAWLNLTCTAWAILTLATGLVWMAESFNTALEAIIDLASPDLHPLAKIGKDVSAAAVLITAITAVIVGAFILGPPFYAKIFVVIRH